MCGKWHLRRATATRRASRGLFVIAIVAICAVLIIQFSISHNKGGTGSLRASQRVKRQPESFESGLCTLHTTIFSCQSCLQSALFGVFADVHVWWCRFLVNLQDTLVGIKPPECRWDIHLLCESLHQNMIGVNTVRCRCKSSMKGQQNR